MPNINHPDPREECGITFREIRHTSVLLKRIGELYLDENHSDVILIVEKEKLFAHKLILTAWSEYFRALFFGGMRESFQDEIVIEECNVDVFKVLLEYMYKGIIPLDDWSVDFSLELLELAHRFAVVDLQTAICDYLRQKLNVQDCCLIYETAKLFNLIDLMRVCALFIDQHVEEVLSHASFLKLSLESLKNLISRDSFFISEVVIFKAVLRWLEANNVSRENSTEILNVVRLPLMTDEELMTVVEPTGLVSPDKLADVIAMKTVDTDSPSNQINYRGVMRMECNMAVEELGAVVLKGEYESVLLNGIIAYDWNSGYTAHDIEESVNYPFILIQLGTPCVTNHIKMLLWDLDLRSYSYRIEVSMDLNSWTQVIDHTRYFCRSWQHLYFNPTVVKYVKIIGTNNTINVWFHLVHFEIKYTDKPFYLEKMLCVPQHNVATQEFGAIVSKGGHHVESSLVYGQIGSDWENCFTGYRLTNACIAIIQLGQPYMLESMRT